MHQQQQQQQQQQNDYLSPNSNTKSDSSIHSVDSPIGLDIQSPFYNSNAEITKSSIIPTPNWGSPQPCMLSPGQNTKRALSPLRYGTIGNGKHVGSSSRPTSHSYSKSSSASFTYSNNESPSIITFPDSCILPPNGNDESLALSPISARDTPTSSGSGKKSSWFRRLRSRSRSPSPRVGGNVGVYGRPGSNSIELGKAFKFGDDESIQNLKNSK